MSLEASIEFFLEIADRLESGFEELVIKRRIKDGK